MKFAVITHVLHSNNQNNYFAYAPYVREMNIWAKNADEFIIVAPLIQAKQTVIEMSYCIEKVRFLRIENINLLGFKSICNAILKTPKISWQIFKALRQADHIHLRCPGNIGLLGCLVQILFPNKPKTAKYAGNWDPNAQQPWSYRLQKWILSNTFLTRNMHVLVYGEWEGSTKNIKPFFTATYSEVEKAPLYPLDLKEKINFVFVGTLVAGKNPLYAIQLVAALAAKGYQVSLDLYGEGIERTTLEKYITVNSLNKIIALKGNQDQETVKKAYQRSHFVFLASKSEGWPKVLAEGMFWGCIPVATAVSCVPLMLDQGNRGVVLQMNLEQDVQELEAIVQNENDFNSKRAKASAWSRKYTVEVFEKEIETLLKL